MCAGMVSDQRRKDWNQSESIDFHGQGYSDNLIKLVKIAHHLGEAQCHLSLKSRQKAENSFWLSCLPFVPNCRLDSIQSIF
jgi:hypothetical protein